MLAVQNCPRGVSSNGFLGEVSISQWKEGFKRQEKGNISGAPTIPYSLASPIRPGTGIPLMKYFTHFYCFKYSSTNNLEFYIFCSICPHTSNSYGNESSTGPSNRSKAFLFSLSPVFSPLFCLSNAVIIIMHHSSKN